MNKTINICWSACSVNDLYEIVGGGTPSTKNENYWDGDIPWITSADIQGLESITPRKKITIDAVEKSAANIVPENSIIVVTRVGLGKLALSREKISFSQDCQGLVGCSKLVLPKYAVYYLSKTVERFKYDNRGTTISGVTKKQLKELPFLLPPVSEQKHIISKIEELFSELDNGIENLKKARDQLKTYRQAVLKYAFEGKLTEEWRENNKLNDNFQVEKLKSEIEKFNVNKSGQDLPRRLPPIDLEKLKQLPCDWFWVEAHKICQSVRDGTHNTPQYVKDGVPLVTSKNLKNGKVDFSNIQYISEKDHVEISRRSKVEMDDVLFGMIGTIGNPVIISSKNNFSIKNVGLFKKNRKLILSKYLKYWLESEGLFRILEENYLIRGTTQKFLSLGSLRVLPVPFCCLAEQKQIVSEIESRLSVCDKLEQIIENSLQKSEALRQSILKKAFSGELTKDWREKHPELISGENSAEKLLERIKAEKEKLKLGKTKKK